MSTCCWCTPGGSSTTDVLREYASKNISCEFFIAANDDLCYCLECVAEYHKARDQLPFLHEVLWELETSRLVGHFEKCIKEVGEDDELFIINDNRETHLSNISGSDFENNLRVPLLEILKYPYLLLNERVSELFVEGLCRMEQANCSFQVFDKHPGIYLLLVHPNEMIRRWAILSARNLGKVDRDDYYDLQEVLTCLFKVIELGLFESPDIYTSSLLEMGKLILLPCHMYDTMNYKNYWLGICLLLTILEEQAMDSLFLGAGKQNDFMKSILHTMERQENDDSMNPFWPALHCFMVILDRLGSKVWGQLIDPIEAFQTIINNVSYNKEIENIRTSSNRAKLEPESNFEEDMVTCSQIVYNYNPGKSKKDSGWRSAICPDYCPNMYEEMETLTNLLQSDIGQDMRVHNSTFLWFIPFVQSIMDLKDLGVAYIVEVIHHLYSEVKDVLNEKVALCDKVTEFFLLILVSVIELHRNKKCLHLLWVSSQQWVEAVVKCAKLPATAFARFAEKSAGSCPRVTSTISGLSLNSQPSNSVQHACVLLIRSILREGYQLGQQTICKQFLDKLNLLLRGNLSLGWQLNRQETQELQMCLKQIVRNINVRVPKGVTSLEQNVVCKAQPKVSVKEESEITGERMRRDKSPTFSKGRRKAGAYLKQENPSSRRISACEEDRVGRGFGASEEDGGLSSESCLDHLKEPVAKRSRDPGISNGVALEAPKIAQGINIVKDFASKGAEKARFEGRTKVPGLWGIESRSNSSENVFRSNENTCSKNEDNRKNTKLKPNIQKDDLCAKLFQVMKQCPRKTKMANQSEDAEANQRPSSIGSCCPKKEAESRRENTVTRKSSLDDCVTPEDAETEGAGSRNDTLVIKEEPNDQINYLAYHKNYDCLQESDSKDEDKISHKVIGQATLEKYLHRQESRTDSLSPSFTRKSNWKETNEFACSVPWNTIREVSAKSVIVSPSSTHATEDHDKETLIAYAKGLSLLSDSAPEDSPQLQNIKRKVKDAVKLAMNNQSDDSVSSVETLKSQVIIISDSSSDEERALTVSEEIKTTVTDIKKGSSERCPSVSNVEDELEAKEGSTSPLESEECDSQMFEFETQEQVYSFWQDSEASDKNLETEQETRLIPTVAHSLEHLNDWGYETDYICDDIIEKVVEDMEKHLEPLAGSLSLEECEKIEVKPGSHRSKNPTAKGPKEPLPNFKNIGQAKACSTAATVKGRSDSDVEASTSASTLSVTPSLSKISNESPGTVFPSKSVSSPYFTSKEPVSQSHKKICVKENKGQNKTLNKTSSKETPSCRSTPAVVPPKKFRPCPEPTSTVERLGLKKRPRKAFELSQRSLDSLAKLRNYGQTAGAVSSHKKQKAKLISPQALVIKNNKKLLACQDLQFLRQMKSEPKKNLKGLPASRSRNFPRALSNPVLAPGARRQSSSGTRDGFKSKVELVSSSDGRRQREDADTEAVQTGRISETVDGTTNPLTKQDSLDSKVRLIQASEALVSSSEDHSRGSFSSGGCGFSGDLEDQVDLQAPLSFGPETKSSREAESKCNDDKEEDNLFLTQTDTVDMELCSQVETFEDFQAFPENEPKEVKDNPQPGASDGIKCKHKDCTEAVVNLGESCSKHSVVKTSDEHLFAKPAVPMSPLFKTAKPPTAKVFSSSSTSRNAAFSKDLEKSPKLPLPLKTKPNVMKPPASKVTKPTPATAQGSVLKPDEEKNPRSVLQPYNKQAPSYFSRSAPPVQPGPKNPYLLVSSFAAQQSYYSSFLSEILKWKCEMFKDIGQLGPPANLCKTILSPVPLSFQNYDDYFNIFFPLMMLNTFETVAQEWLENQKKDNSYQLHLRSFYSGDVNSAKFMVYVKEKDMAKQLHPKEDDLILLEVPGGISGFAAEKNEVIRHPVYHTAYVSQFTRSSARHTDRQVICNVAVQTKSNLASYINQPVKCTIISSLVTTQRKFRALLSLSRSPLAGTIINPHISDFCPRDSVKPAPEKTVAYLKDFNEDQKKAIETAYSMVMLHPSLPRICLIHGPPGTGKSRTIIGLLHRILNETPKERPAPNLNAKIKRNRVLVCAPSNAAIDELMKKIILEFKEKCQNKKSPLGNCGDINLVRLGPEKSISSEVLKFSLDSQVNYRMKKALPSRDQDLHKRKEALDHQLDQLSRQRAMDRCEKGEKSQNLDEEIARLSAQREQLASKLKEVRGRPQEIQSNIILGSHIICCTLSTSGGFLLESAFRRQGYEPFSCVIVDEAGQACELETLIPLIHRCNKLVLVGDPKQLPPTIISLKAQEFGFDQSMMARLCKNLENQVEQNLARKAPILQLTFQYRMHPDICLFPSNYIYGRSLKTSRATEEARCSLDWPFLPYLVFDVEDGLERREHESYFNFQEIKLVIELIKMIKDKEKDITSRNIGVITPYKSQKKMIQCELDKEFEKIRLGEVDTVDGFQGRQKDCIIVTCVRANSTQDIGFLSSVQRLNVTITRAKYSLFILGHLKTLMENKDWSQLIQDAQRRGAIIRTCEANYRQDVRRILKPKLVSQQLPLKAAEEKTRPQAVLSGEKPKDTAEGLENITSSPTIAPSLPSPQCGGPSNRAEPPPPDHQKKGAQAAPGKALITSPAQNQPRDPRLAWRRDFSAKERPPKEPTAYPRQELSGLGADPGQSRILDHSVSKVAARTLSNPQPDGPSTQGSGQSTQKSRHQSWEGSRRETPSPRRGGQEKQAPRRDKYSDLDRDYRLERGSHSKKDFRPGRVQDTQENRDSDAKRRKVS
ncbi:probable helicase senataxin [Tachyglossus aculeatus]|uniref:probable helicase senataxin n=1 Tax=Tachyglossus aculeatus TaxID=9261 RepID=UPI0018F4C740|nr:probable helicase senataxin [Tachyglossus aculeatus]